MNILVIGKFYTEGFALHIAETLQAMGHEVHRFEPGVKYTNNGSLLSRRWTQVKGTIYELSRQLPSIQRLQMGRLLKIAKSNAIQLTIVCYDFIMPQEVSLLKQVTGSPIVLWFPDHIGNFHKSFFLNADYDALFFKDPYIVYILKKILDKPIYYLPECFNPRRHSVDHLLPEDVSKYACDITTAGNLYPYRVAFFSQLKSHDIKIWGGLASSWLDVTLIEQMLQKVYVVNEEKAKAFRAAKIVVNNLNPAEIWGLNCRAFEVAGAGGFQLIDWRPALNQLFEDGKEVVCFRSMEELKRKIDYYLCHDEKRLDIARRGMLRAQKEHTYEKRLTCLLETIFGNGGGFLMPSIP